MLNGAFECYGLEDEYRRDKVAEETRIPGGEYRVAFRTYGRHHERYEKIFADIHIGMLEITGVPGFTDILIHRGNTEKDTAGCLLVGDEVNNNRVEPGLLSASTSAYRRFYTKVADALANGEEVTIEFKNIGEEVKA
jgi:hypothetical protein